MVMIKVILLGGSVSPFFMRHIAAIVTDVETGRHYLVNYPFGSYSESDPRAESPDKAMVLYEKCRPNLCIDVTTLYSRTSYDKFLSKFCWRFNTPFSKTKNNCATVVREVLEFFCADIEVDYASILLQMLKTMPYSPLQCFYITFLQYLTDLTEISTPGNIFDRAVWLASLKGIDSLTTQEVESLDHIPVIIPGTNVDVSRYQDELDETLFKHMLKPLKMI